MRRTFNSFALVIDTSNLVTRSISGHLTEQMLEEYTTSWSPKQRQALDTVIGLLGKPSHASAPRTPGVVLRTNAPRSRL